MSMSAAAYGNGKARPPEVHSEPPSLLSMFHAFVLHAIVVAPERVLQPVIFTVKNETNLTLPPYTSCHLSRHHLIQQFCHLLSPDST